MTDPFAKLSLFATDLELAAAVVGKARAAHYAKAVLPYLKHFPRKDELHGGWPVPLVKKFYDGYLGVVDDCDPRIVRGEENPEAWTRKRKRTPKPED